MKKKSSESLKETAPFGFEKPEDSPGFLLWQATVTWQRHIKKELEPYAISHSQFVLMALLLWFEKHGEEATQITLIKWSRLDKMTVSMALKKLEKEGFVSRKEHPEDTRSKKVSLQKKGKELISKLVPLVEATDEKFFGVALKKDEPAFTYFLRKLVERNP